MTTDDRISVRECAAIRLLARDGWTKGELRLTFNVTRARPVKRHATGECGHAHGMPPLEQFTPDDPPTVDPKAHRRPTVGDTLMSDAERD